MRRSPPGTTDTGHETSSQGLEGRIRRALAGTPVALFSQDASLRYDWIFNAHTDVDPAHVIGRTDEELFSPETAGPIVAIKRAVLTTGDEQRATVTTEPRGGGPRRVHDLHVEAMRDGEGRIAGIVGTAVDVTELRAEAEAARRAETRFRDSVESLMDPFGVYSAVRDAGGRIVDFRVEHVNEAACRANMMSREEQEGQLLCEILPGHRQSGLFDAYCELVETGEPLRRRDEMFEDEWGGQHLVRAFDIQAARHGDGFVATWRDVTEQRKQELALAMALKESDLLRRELEHRVMNNLQILASLIGLSARAADGDAASALMMARQQVELVASLHAKLRARPGEPDRIALDEYLVEICGAMRAGLDLPQHGIALEVETVPASLGANEAISLGLVVNELVTNAVKHAFVGRKGGVIRVGLAGNEELLLLTVADDGVGVAATRAEGGGSGNRLTTRLAESLGGELACESSPAGTTFRLSFRGGPPVG